MMTVLWLILGGASAGFVVTWLADTLPARQDWRTTWRWPLQRLGLLRVPDNATPSTIAPQAPQPPMWRYWLIWLAALALSWLAATKLGWNWQALLVALQAWFFLAVAVIDLEHRLVLNRMLLAALPFVMATNLALGGPTLPSALLGALAGFASFLLIALLLPGGMGMGDVKLAGLIGLTTGVAGILPALMIGIFVGGLASMVILAVNRFRRGQTIAYAPYLVIGVWVVLFSGLRLVL